MSAVAQPLKQFIIPTAAELDAIMDDAFKAVAPINEIELKLKHATRSVDTPLSEFARRPTFEDIGALFIFAGYVDSLADSLKGWSREIVDLLTEVDEDRKNWDHREGDDA
jgi:hypothetical protein